MNTRIRSVMNLLILFQVLLNFGCNSSPKKDYPITPVSFNEVKIYDSFQTKNLINNPEFKRIADEFRSKLKKKMEELNDAFEKCTWYRDHWTDDNRNILRGAKA